MHGSSTKSISFIWFSSRPKPKRSSTRTHTTTYMVAAFGFDCESFFSHYYSIPFILIIIFSNFLQETYQFGCSIWRLRLTEYRSLSLYVRCRQRTVINPHCFIFKRIILRHVWQSFFSLIFNDEGTLSFSFSVDSIVGCNLCAAFLNIINNKTTTMAKNESKTHYWVHKNAECTSDIAEDRRPNLCALCLHT